MAPPKSPPLYIERARRQRLTARARAELAKRSFPEFVRQAWAAMYGAKVLEWTPFLQGICEEIQGLIEGWLVATGRATQRQRARVIARWEELGLTFEEGAVLVQNEIFNLPPGTLKSTLIMVFGPAWVWLHAPTASFCCTSANDDNVKRDSDGHRDLVSSSWYRTTFGIRWKIKTKSHAVGRWETTAGGLRISRTYLSGFTGIHVDFFLVDDPDDAQKVWNASQRKSTHGQFTNALEDRIVHPKQSIRIVTQQRVHSDDLSNHLRSLLMWSPQERAGWASFIVPLRYGRAPKDIAWTAPASGWVDPRTVPDDLMQRSRFDEKQLAEKEIKLGTHGVNAQYDQNPDVIDGGMFLRAYWRFFRVEDALPGQPGFYPSSAPADPRPRPDGLGEDVTGPAYIVERDKHGKVKLDFLTISIDSTFGSLDEKTASAVGLLVIGGQAMRRFIFHDATDLMTFLQLIAAIKELLKRFPARRVIIELKANGTSVIETLQREVAEGKLLGPDGRPIVVVVEGVSPGSDSKIARAIAMLPAVQAGLWYLLEGAHWIPRFLAEVCVFPHAKRDDRVDAMSQAATYYSDSNTVVQNAMALARW